MNILEELYYGNIRPTEKSFSRTSEYARLCTTMTDNERKLREFLAALPNAEKEQQLFAQMLHAQGEVSSFGDMDRFVEGFRLGARFTLDAFVMPDNSVIRDIV